MACACWCCWCCGGVADEAEALKSKCAAIPGRFLSTTSFPLLFPLLCRSNLPSVRFVSQALPCRSKGAPRAINDLTASDELSMRLPAIKAMTQDSDFGVR
ncbi:hypothetical protein V8C44DRAFT_337086 [Trichoderma aethiopicum]